MFDRTVGIAEVPDGYRAMADRKALKVLVTLTVPPLRRHDMDKRILGSGKLQVSALGFGCMGMSQSFGPNPGDRDQMIDLLRTAVERGVTLFDTAEVYGPFVNEELVGEALAPVREQVVIATKFGFAFDEQGRQTGLSSRPEHIRQAADGSLRRLGVDTIDLLYQHRVDPQVPIEDVAGTVKELDRGGEGRATSACPRQACAPSAARTRCTRSPRYRASTRCSGANPRPRSSRHWRSSASGWCPFSPLGRGFLTGRIDQTTTFGDGDVRANLPRFTAEARQANQALVDLLGRIAADKGATPAQIALAWLLAQQPVDRPHPRHPPPRTARGEPRRPRRSS